MKSNPISAYLAEIGRRGGQKSRRKLPVADARRMVAVREARKAFQKHRVDCFWSFRDITITADKVPWVVEQLRTNGGRDAWETAGRIKSLLCR